MGNAGWWIISPEFQTQEALQGNGIGLQSEELYAI
jgi:hypothetical protein